MYGSPTFPYRGAHRFLYSGKHGTIWDANYSINCRERIGFGVKSSTQRRRLIPPPGAAHVVSAYTALIAARKSPAEYLTMYVLACSIAEVAMSRELRVTLAIMIVALVLFSPAIFAAPSPANTNYLALVLHIVPPPFINCQVAPNPNAAPNYPVRITAINKVAETVTLKNVSTEAVSLNGWVMCSITGNQPHPISGTLAPGASQTFPGPAGIIWNNSAPDPGALYDPNGQLVSYFNS